MHIRFLTRATWSLIFILGMLMGGVAGFASGQVAVTTHHNDNSRTGQNLTETVLNTSNVNVSNFGKLFSRNVDGQIYAQPLYVPDLAIAGQIRNAVYVATQNNSVYAFDADDPNASAPLWNVNFGTPVPSTDVASDCADITPQIGITSTPVIDSSTSTLYVVAKTKDVSDGTYYFNLHALDLGTGTEKFGGPTQITAQVAGNGAGSSGGILTLDPLHQFNRPGLLLLNDTVYVAFGGACETPPWHGWIFGYSASTLQQVSVLNTTPNGSDGGIWGGGEGLLADSANNIYVMTGNGTFDAPTGGDYGDSVLKISTASGLSILDYFTPTNQADLNNADMDLGSGGPMALPGTNLIVGSGKDGILRLVDTTNLGGYSTVSNNNLQNFQGTTGLVFTGAPIYWNSPNYGPVIYVWADSDTLKAYQFANGIFQTTPVSQGTIVEAAGGSNSVPLSLSANGNRAGTGIIWGSGALSQNGNHQTVSGILWAFDATDLTNELWDSNQDPARDDPGDYAKFSPPTIANGKVYEPTFSNQLVVYGLLAPADFALDPQSSSQSVATGEAADYQVVVTSENGFNRAVSFTCSGVPVGANCSFSPAWVNPISGPATTTLTVTTALSTPQGTSTVSITANSGSLQHVSAVSLTVTASNPAPAVGAVSPALGTATGGTALTITGTNFLSGATVSLGGNLATNVTVVNSSKITATAPAHAVGAVNVVVTNSDTQSGTLPNGYTYTGQPDFTIAASAFSPATIASGGSATSALTFTPIYGFDGALSLSCNIAPAVTSPPTCGFSPSSVTGLGTSTLTIRTIAATKGSLAPRSQGAYYYAMWLPAAGLLLFGAGVKSHRQRLLWLLFECVLFAGLIALAACGGGNSSPQSSDSSATTGTPSGNYTVTVTVSGSVTHTATVTFTVK